MIDAELHPDVVRLARIVGARELGGALVGEVDAATSRECMAWLGSTYPEILRVPTTTLGDRFLALVGWVEVAQQRAALERLSRAEEE